MIVDYGIEARRLMLERLNSHRFNPIRVRRRIRLLVVGASMVAIAVAGALHAIGYF